MNSSSMSVPWALHRFKLRPLDTEGTPFARLNGLPSDWQAVTEWSNRDAAFADIAAGIRKVAAKLNGRTP